MSPKTHEHTLNDAIANALHSQRRGWAVAAEQTGVMKAAGKRPDIIVRQNGRPRIVIENEFAPANNVEQEASDRLGKEFSDGEVVRIAAAMISPESLQQVASTAKTANDEELKKRVMKANFKYALFSGAKNHARFPESGWLTGDLTALAEFIYRASIPAEAVEAAAEALETGVQAAGDILGESDAQYKSTGENITKILKQEYGKQTRRMAMAILANALAFQNHLAGHKNILSVQQCVGPYNGKPRVSAIKNEWNKILTINYWPIFEVARDIILTINPTVAQRIVDRLAATVQAVAEDEIFLSHDLFGMVFQRLIADRKFLATFYTRPSSAALLAYLAIPEDAPFEKGSWEKDAKNYTIADFACGTGALLTAAYQRVSELHEREGGDASASHPDMMSDALVGCDVMPAAAHLTASILSGAHPNREFDRTQIYTMPYGEPEKGEYRIGSLDLLAKQSFLPVVATSARQERGKGRGKIELREIPWRSANLVIMNPPFTRAGNHEGGHKDVPNPAFAAFGADAELQKNLGERAKELRKRTCGNGNAGTASDFVALADRMVRANGTVALVLPLSVLAGQSWQKVRALWAQKYEDILVVTLSASGTDEYAFSADTGMGEMLFVGRRLNGKPQPPNEQRGVFVVLDKRPENEIEAAEIARIIRRAMRGKVRQLEDGPVGGTPLKAGKSEIGGLLNAPMPDADGPWTIARIRSFSLAQTAHEVSQGRLWFSRESKGAARKIPIVPLGDFAERGFIARDISGTEENGKPRAPFDMAPIRSTAADYPCLWAHNAQRETRMLVEPDQEGTIRNGMENRALEIWATAGRAHYNADFRFNSQPLAVAMTEKPTIGGQAWPNVIIGNRKYEDAFALWGNSTLGLLCYWWWSSKQQEGRGRISPLRLLGMPTLNVAALKPAQLTAAHKGFNKMKSRQLLPFYRAAEDETRAELDRVILCEVLELPKKVLDGVARVREKLCAEPSICGGRENAE